MATVRRQTYKGRDGKRKESAKWYACVVTPRGEKRIPGYKDKSATMELARKCERIIGLRSESMPLPPDILRWLDGLDSPIRKSMTTNGIIDGDRAAKSKPIRDHLTDYRQYLIDSGSTRIHAKRTYRSVERIIDATRAKSAADLTVATITRAIAEFRKDVKDPKSEKTKRGIGAATSNNLQTAVKGFMAWMLRERRIHENPLAHVRRMNVDTDRRHERRPMESDELSILLDVTSRQPKRWNMTGPERSALYRIAAETGLRSNEIRSLTRDSFTFDNGEATVTVQAGYSKRRQHETMPLRDDLVEILRPLLSRKLPSAPAFTLPNATNVARMLRDDLKAARAAWLAQAKNVADRQDRERQSFLVYRDDADRVTDFHSLRGAFISMMLASGIDAKTAQSLARHSDPRLTFNTYGRTLRGSERAAIDGLPSFDVPETTKAAATGTDGDDDAAARLQMRLQMERAKRALSGSSPCSLDDAPKRGKIASNKGKNADLPNDVGQKKDWARPDSNREPRDYESLALTN